MLWYHISWISQFSADELSLLQCREIDLWWMFCKITIPNLFQNFLFADPLILLCLSLLVIFIFSCSSSVFMCVPIQLDFFELIISIMTALLSFQDCLIIHPFSFGHEGLPNSKSIIFFLISSSSVFIFFGCDNLYN